MAKRHKHKPSPTAHATEATVEFVPTHPLPEPVEPIDVEADPDVGADIARKHSVVKHKYKVRYATRAIEAGIKNKAAKRSAWDWLAQTIAAIALDDKKALKVDEFLALLDANGVDHSRWTNRSVGWQGRLRMTGRLALQRVVAESGVLKTADGEELVPPTEWVEHYKN